MKVYGYVPTIELEKSADSNFTNYYATVTFDEELMAG